MYESKLIAIYLLTAFISSLNMANASTLMAIPKPYKCLDSESQLSCATKVEKSKIASSSNAIRNEKSLELTGDTGKVILLDTENLKYRYAGEINQFHLVKILMSEGWAFMIVHADTLERTALPGPISFSPDNTMFISVSEDLEAGYRPNLVEVYQLSKSGTPIKIYSKSDFPDFTGPSNVSWINNSSFNLTLEQWDPETDKLFYSEQIIHLGASDLDKED